MADVSAVRTTGIYCLPGCPARPARRNVRAFPLAAAAEAAGYRACLRCRPYRSEPSLGPGHPELVCRAVQLILDGALDGSTDAHLAARMGISTRHLRRLFSEHLGVTPDRLARSRRAHFARRLLDDTDLTMLEIACAAGFGSARQLSRACREVFHDTPSGLRARRRAADRLSADGGLHLRLPFHGPLDWEAMLAYFQARAIAGVESVGQGAYRRTISIDGDPGVLEISAPDAEHLLLCAHLPHWEGLIHVVERARRIFNLAADPHAIGRAFEGDVLIGRLIEARPGVRVPGTWDPFETGVRAIVGQQVSVAGANTLIARLVQRHGSPVAGLSALGLSHTFPAPAPLAEADLDGLGLTSARIDAVHAFARAVVTGDVALDRSAALTRLIDSLTAIPGLGPWTAHYLALRMGEPDAFPASDLGIRRSLAAVLGHPPAAAEVDRRAEEWRPWRALAATQLWLDG
jgi:AraC family transcriptional regulator of adaptative response / DNA-3-methyladenine glycosylase II